MPKAIAVVHLVAQGITVAQACEREFMSVASFRSLLAREPELDAMLKEAVQIGNDILADMLVNIDRQHDDARMAGVISKNIQWVLERRDAEKFGQRIVTDPNNEQSKTLAAALLLAMERIPAAPTPLRITDATFEIVPDKVAAPVGEPEPLVREETLADDHAGSLDDLRALGLL